MRAAKIVRGLAWRLRAWVADALLLGPGVAKHRLYALGERSECTLRLAGVGRVVVRPRDSDLLSFRDIFHDGAYRFPTAAVEEAVEHRYRQLIDAGRTPVIVDAGAYVGASALWFASLFAGAQIVAIEPDPDNFALLERNLRGREQVTPIRAAVGARAGHVAVVATPQSWAIQVKRADVGTPVVTLNDAFATVGGGEPFLAKINVEGFEDELFSSNLEWLDKVAVLFIEPHDWLLPGRHSSRSLQRAMGERDFHLFIVGSHLCYVRL